MNCTCGGYSFVRDTPARGVWREFITFLGDEVMIESTTDWLKHGKTPKSMTCEQCGKRHKYDETK